MDKEHLKDALIKKAAKRFENATGYDWTFFEKDLKEVFDNAFEEGGKGEGKGKKK